MPLVSFWSDKRAHRSRNSTKLADKDGNLANAMKHLYVTNKLDTISE